MTALAALLILSAGPPATPEAPQPVLRYETKAVLQDDGSVQTVTFVYRVETPKRAPVTATLYTASWCGPCQLFKPTWAALRLKYPGVAFETVDVDANPGALNRAAGVSGSIGIPAIVVVRDGVAKLCSSANVESALK